MEGQEPPAVGTNTNRNQYPVGTDTSRGQYQLQPASPDTSITQYQHQAGLTSVGTTIGRNRYQPKPAETGIKQVKSYSQVAKQSGLNRGMLRDPAVHGYGSGRTGIDRTHRTELRDIHHIIGQFESLLAQSRAFGAE